MKICETRAVQLASALPQTDLVEYLTGSPYVDELVVDGWRWTRMACWRSRLHQV